MADGCETSLIYRSTLPYRIHKEQFVLDTIASERRSENMRAIRSKGMKPELAVRKLVHALGFRYRLHQRDLPGKPDLVFPGRRKIIFVHGCFWHQHGDQTCKVSRVPKSRPEYWLPKLERNKQRDAEHLQSLKEAGWKVLVLWECEVSRPMSLRRKIRTFLR